MKLYMIRHGESEANVKKVFAGQTDSLLTKKGVEDARKARELLKNIDFDRIYCSDLTRAYETCKIALPGITPTKTKLLREINVGSLAGKSVAECTAEFGEIFLTHQQRYNFTTYGGENSELLKERILEFLSILEKNPCEKVAAFCHGGVIHSMLEIVSGSSIDNVICSNCSVNIFEFNNGIWQMSAWNYTGTI